MIDRAIEQFARGRRIDEIERINRMTMLAEQRRDSILHEIDRYRLDFSQRLRRAVDEVEDAEFKVIEPQSATQEGTAQEGSTLESTTSENAAPESVTSERVECANGIADIPNAPDPNAPDPNAPDPIAQDPGTQERAALGAGACPASA